MDPFSMYAGALIAGVLCMAGEGLWWLITTDSRVVRLEADVKRLTERLDDADKERWRERYRDRS